MVYEYTKPRVPIAAMYQSPGPCYALPGLVGQVVHDPRSVHFRGPAYPFGIQHGKWRNDCSPGPCYLPNPKVYRTGADGTPHYSLASRPKGLTPFKSPGPGAYCPEAGGPNSKPMPPQYSFGSRHQNRRTDNTPAPNSYILPTMLGQTMQSGKRQAPCYSMTGRSKTGSFHEDLQKTPGPGTYRTTDTSLYRYSAPQYSMTSRHPMTGDTTQKPGPGAHSPEKQMGAHKKSVPAYSFGIRHSEYISPLIVSVE